MKLSQKLKTEAAPIIEKIYKDDFIQHMIKGDIDNEAIKHYLKADSRYLHEFAKIYALLIPKVDNREEVEFLTEQINFANSGEVEAHHILANYVGEDYETIIADGHWFPAADHYVKHMYYHAYAYDHVAYTVAAMAPCPYVYQQIGKKAIQDGVVKDDNPLKKWFEFYNKEMDELMTYIENWLDKTTDGLSQSAISDVENAFLQSVVHERRFFQMAYDKQDWEYKEEK